jgi:predicted amidohydrolase
MANRTLRLGLAQMQPVVRDLPANMDTVADFVARAEQQNVELLLFPELALSGYPVRAWFSEASLRPDGEEVDRLRALSKRVALCVGFIEETQDAEFFNSAICLIDGQITHVHRKIYLPTYGLFDERRYFASGWGVGAFETPWGRMAMLICGDCWHVALPYLAVHDGADLLLVLAASAREGLSETIPPQAAWERMNQSYALTLSTFLAFCNLVGSEEGMHFWGGSHLVLPDGNMLAQASVDQPELLVAELEMSLLRKQRLVLPFRRDDSLLLTHQIATRMLARKAERRDGFLSLLGAGEGPPASTPPPPSTPAPGPETTS